MPTRVCLSTANTLCYPQGGHLWVFINWALGFSACGCDVYWLDIAPPDIQLKGQRIEDSGFEVVNAHEVTATPIDYRGFIQSSLGEFSAAKPSYVRLKTAWMSDRTICYLASGKPCVGEDTGPIDSLSRFDKGLHRFADRSGAIRALERVLADYETEALSARSLAEELFDSKKVCHRILSLAL